MSSSDGLYCSGRKSASANKAGRIGLLGWVAGCQVSSKSIEWQLDPFINAAIPGRVRLLDVPQISAGSLSLILSVVFAKCWIVLEKDVVDPIRPTPMMSSIILLLRYLTRSDNCFEEKFDTCCAVQSDKELSGKLKWVTVNKREYHDFIWPLLVS